MHKYPVSAVLRLHQAVEAMDRETDRTPEVRERYARDGLLLVTAGVIDGLWHREMVEFELAPAALAAVRARDTVPLADLLKLTADVRAGRSTQTGLPAPVAIRSDPLNTDPGIDGGTVQVPIDPDLLYLPTVLPAVPATPAAVGQEWPGQVAVASGAGQFTVRYTAKLAARAADGPTVSITLDPAPSTFKAGEIELTLVASGTWTSHLPPDAAVPITSAGTLRVAIRAKHARGGTPVDIEVLSRAIEFDLARVPASFTENTLITAGWRSKAAAP